MSTTRKHFGLKSREESYMFKELEKLRQETKKDFLQFKQKLASRPALEADSGLRLLVPRPAAPGELGASRAWPGLSEGSPAPQARASLQGAPPSQPPAPQAHASLQGAPPSQPPAPQARASLQGAPPSQPPAPQAHASLQGAPPSPPPAPGSSRCFRPQDFYRRSSAFLRLRRPGKPPPIAAEAGTSRAVVLRPPPGSPPRPRARRSPGSPKPAAPRRVLPRAPKRAASPKEPRAPRPEPPKPSDRRASPVSSEDSEPDAGWRRRRVRIRSRYVSLGEGAAGSCRVPPGSDAREAAPATPPARAIPTSIDEIIASLQSEAQLASDQTIKELIQSILGQKYDIKMEDISLMEKMYLNKPQLQAETPQIEAEQGLQISFEEPQMSVFEELPEAVSSIFQIEQEEISEWEASEAESMMCRSQEISQVQTAEGSSKPWENGQPKRDSKVLKQISVKVNSSGFLQIKGREVRQTRKRKSRIPSLGPRKSLKPCWCPNLPKKVPQVSSIPHLHDLCTTVPAQKLPPDLCLASRLYHTANKKGHSTLLGIFGSCFVDDNFTDVQKDRILYGIPVSREKEECVNHPPVPPRILPELTQRTGQHAHKLHLPLLGKEMSAYPECSKLFWNPAAPKFSVPESVMRETLYPKYESAQTSRILVEKFLFESKENIILDHYYRGSFKSLLQKKSASFENISKCFNAQSTQLKRARSAVELRQEEEPIKPLEIKDDTQSNMKEVMFQKKKELEHQLFRQSKPEEPVAMKESIDDILETIQVESNSKDLSLSLIEASKKAGITYIVYPKRRKRILKKRLKFRKLSFVYEQLSKPPNKIERSTSHGTLPGEKKYLLKVPLYELQMRCPSLPMYLNFDKFVENKGGMQEDVDPQTWAISKFIKIKPQKVASQTVQISEQKELPEKVKEPLKLELSDSLKCDLPPEVIKYYESEVAILTEEINNQQTYPAFAYCRRGAIYRKLGKLQSAMSDLQQAILLEPLFLNAYWHRHFVYLFQDKINDALDDLNYINKYNKNNTEAYLSKAEIFRKKGEITLAILNYTQAIKCRPTDADIYFRRGEMYDKDNKVLAIDDFSKCIFYNPKRTDALFKRGLFHYENENWISATQDFTALLDIEDQNSQARTYRGRAYFKRHLYKEATQDFSAAIHLDPNNWLALYYRGCIFRKTNPLRALQDYSISALLNDGYENLSCFLHRGIVYVYLKLWLLAICDFETVISLERTVTTAYINIGLIHLLYLSKYTEANWYFSEAIKIDPLCIQSYICRAETYYKLHNLKRAVNELSRAIHLQPDGIQLYIIRGQYLHTMKCYDLAKFTIYQVAEMNQGLIELSPIQQALIYSFCENHDKAIQVLDGIMWNRPEISMYVLLAKAQMKAKITKEAVKMFKKALEVLSRSDKESNSIAITTDCLYNLGLCYMEEGNIQMAFEFFTKAVKTNPDFADGFYQRGLCKVKLQKDTSIMDFNRAITLNPKHYQAYLSRAAFYGSKGRYSKAIFNCSEALRIYPESVRAYVYRGVLKYYNRSFKLAITDLTIAINMNKNCYLAFYNRALCYTKIRELQMALADYSVVLLLNAEETLQLNTFTNRGLIYVELEKYGYALEDFKEAALISQTNVSLCQATAMCHHRIKEFEEAVNFYTWAIKMNPHFLDAHIGRGNSYMEYGHDEATKQAQKDFLKALHCNPSYTKARISLGYNLQAQGKFQKAWNHFTIVIETDPKSYLAYEGRAVVCLQMSNNFAAMQDINAALKINTTAEFLTNRGVIHEFMGQLQNAMKDYQAAVSLDPKYSLAYFNAGNIYFRHRQFSQATDYFSKALMFDPQNYYALMNRAIANTTLEDYKEAKEDFACLIERCPSWAAAYFNRAHLNCCLKQYEQAEEDLSKALSLKPDDAAAYNLRAKVHGKLGLIEKAMADYNQALDLEEYASVT